MCRVAFVSVLAAACGAGRAVDSGAATRVPEQRAVAGPPAYLGLEIEPASLHPQQVRIVRAGPVRIEHDARPVVEGSGRTVSVVARLVDADEYGAPSRPTVLCVGERHRIAVVLERDDLATVTATRSWLGPSPGTGPALADTPGITVASGTALRIDGRRDAEVLRVIVERPGLRAHGFAKAADVGLGFAPESVVVPGVATTKLGAPTTLHAMPGGVAIAGLDPRASIEPMLVRRLGPERGDEVLVQVSISGVDVVGWAKTPMLVEGAWSNPRGIVAAAIAESGEGPKVAVRRGTLLRGGPLRAAIGVVTQDAELRCVEACETETPKVAVAACTTMLEVWAD